MALLTVRELRAMKDGDRLSESAGRGQGTLRFRKTGGRVRVYFRFTKPDGGRDELPLGWYDEGGRDGWTLAQVREEASKVRERLQTGSGDIRADQEAERAAREAARQAEERAREQAEREAIEREKYTLSELCSAYVRLLASSGKEKSASDTRSSFNVHVLKAHPEIAALPANQITPHQIAAMVRTVREAGKERAGGQLRTYLRAAFGAAIRAPFDSRLPSELIAFNVNLNPVDPVPAIRVRAGERTLSKAELREYMGHLGAGIVDQSLMLALLSGGQRINQVLRARVLDWDAESNTLRLWDPKGRRLTAREHLLPLAPRAAAVVSDLIERAHEVADGDPNPPLFISRDRYGKPATMVYTTASARASVISKSMGGEPFDLRDIRRTVETHLAGLGISRDTRAQLLSHGLSGVQSLHYDRHNYRDEKAAALLAWERHLSHLEDESSGSNVVEIKRRVEAA
ncbi:MAG: integrase [Gammaproteobacteria bacterium]|nr:integrase [Gammaproteobacteria bacterium]